MNNEEKILDKLDKIDGRLDGLEGRFDGLEGRFDGLEGRFDGLEGRFDGLEGRFDGLETKQDFLAIEVFNIKEYMHNELATKQELSEVESRLTDHIVGLAKSYQDHDSEISALNSRMSRVEGRTLGI